MKILIYGAGVIGTIYAARLHSPEHEVSVLARGERLADLRQHGVILRHAIAGDEMFSQARIVTELAPEDNYDMVIVAVRLNQLATVMPALTANRQGPAVLFMVNNAGGYAEWFNAVGADRLMVGFPGVAGSMNGPFVEYMQAPAFLQKTNVGEPDGRNTARLRDVVHILRRAGFPVSVRRNMDAWQKTHASLVVPLAAGLYAVDCCGAELTHNPHVAKLTIRAVRECFAVLRELHVPITPARLRLLDFVPARFLEDLLLQWARTPEFDVLVTRHVRAARDEMTCVADQLLAFARITSLETPALDELSQSLKLDPLPARDALAMVSR